MSARQNQISMLILAATKEMMCEIERHDIAMYRGHDVAMQAHRERTKDILDSLLDLKKESFDLAMKGGNGRESA